MDFEDAVRKFLMPEQPEAARMVSLDPLVPGCGWSIAEPYHLPVEAGIRAERERLRGRAWLVVLYERSLHYDGILETVRLDEGFDENGPALARAGVLLRERIESVRALHPLWRVGRRHVRWPVLAEVAGKRVQPLQDFFIDDGEGWENHHIHVAVLALPTIPIDKELFDAIGAADELRFYFGEIGGR